MNNENASEMLYQFLKLSYENETFFLPNLLTIHSSQSSSRVLQFYKIISVETEIISIRIISGKFSWLLVALA